jgi:hypothetical protein
MRAPISIVLLVLTVAACADDAITTVSHHPTGVGRAIVSSQAAPSVPLRGSCEIRAAAPAVVTPPFIRETDIGTCQLGHLGRAAFYGEQIINFVTRTQVAPVMIFTAANGDELHAANVGSNTPTGPGTIRFTGRTTIVGGTGRFANATGQLSVEGTADFASTEARMTFDGWIAYDAADGARQ